MVVFGDNRLIRYSLIGAGMIFATMILLKGKMILNS